ncbi:hypothetical protein HGRIS_000185 [Hohenbuehelia grisea]|uniref:F-box domain-containing protein n=1 Tax=Hohenbuehelia grisea TaxID=104357 RepID=A0ABR3JR29_9AGAR
MRALWTDDIIKKILDHLSDDTKSLAACSLVSTKWAPASRAVLFHDYHLHVTRHNAYDFVLHILPYQGSRWSLFPHIRYLTLDDEAPTSGWRPSIYSMIPRGLSLANGKTIDVTFKHVECSQSCSATRLAFYPMNQQPLTSLSLHSVAFLLAEDLLTMITAFNALEHLELGAIEFLDSDSKLVFRLKAPRNLRSLTVSGPFTDGRSGAAVAGIWPWLLGDQPPLIISTLRLNHIDKFTAKILLAGLKPSLNRLEISHSDAMVDLFLAYGCVDILQDHKYLRRLHFYNASITEQSRSLLSFFPSTHLTTISISHRARFFAGSSGTSIDFLVQAIQLYARRFPALEEIHVTPYLGPRDSFSARDELNIRGRFSQMLMITQNANLCITPQQLSRDQLSRIPPLPFAIKDKAGMWHDVE